MKVLTAAEMREVDRRTEELGISGPILMENAGHRVVEFVSQRWPILSKQRIVVLCGKGNNGGDGMVIARQLFTRFKVASLHCVVMHPEEASGPLQMLRASGCPVFDAITQEMRAATLVIDAILGFGMKGPARSKALEWIREINTGFPHAKVVAVDLPSGMNSDAGTSEGEVARADVCVTFTALKRCHAFPPNCDRTGEVVLGRIGSPDVLMSDVKLHVIEARDFAQLLQPRERDSNKGDYGHALIIGGAAGKTGAAEMSGLAALRTGAGLVTVASSATGFLAPELMAESLPQCWQELEPLTHRKRVLALGPGLGTTDWAISLVRNTVQNAQQAMVIDADALNALAGFKWNAQGRFRALTPHPGEMSRLLNRTIDQIQSDRLASAQEYSHGTGAVVVLKGHRTVIAFPDGSSWINPTGSPALAKGGTGDILTGIMAGMLSQFPERQNAAVLASVYLHGLAGQRAARDLTEQCVLATEVLSYLPEAMRECAHLSNIL
ncbi:MAG TPA: NAD(P)H-hydrate dehydratase [Bryobacteraceae bacterium]|nr:NAD(P)H-hydrate dehydratase [Bryobacteraceae bacterium]